MCKWELNALEEDMQSELCDAITLHHTLALHQSFGATTVTSPSICIILSLRENIIRMYLNMKVNNSN